jgi:hypothetical protein
VIAVIRFQLSGYLRSVRALHPVLALALLLAIVFSSPLGATPVQIRQGALTAFGDLATLVFPICAWAARGLLDTEPDVQRHVSAVTAGRWRAVSSGSLAAYAFSAVLAVIAPVYPLVEAARYGVGAPVMLLGIALFLLSALAATALGALTSRAVLASPGTSILVLLGACALNLLLGMGPLRVLSVPMIEWMRAAGHGPSAFTRAFPALALRTLGWSAVAGALYAWLRRTRP